MSMFARKIAAIKNEFRDCAKEIAIQRSCIRYLEREGEQFIRFQDNVELALDKVNRMIENTFNSYEAQNNVFSSRLEEKIDLSRNILKQIIKFKNFDYRILVTSYFDNPLFNGHPHRLKVKGIEINRPNT